MTLLSMLSMLIFTCVYEPYNGEDEDDNNSSSGSNSNLKKGQIEIKVYPNSGDYKVSFTVNTREITIDWGDGFSSGKLTPNGVSTFSHTYGSQNLRTIYIESANLVSFSCTGRSHDGTLTELYCGEMNELETLLLENNNLTVLEIKKAGALTNLYCVHGQLTSLNVSGCTALKELNCRYNQLSVNALNSLFESLPNRPAKDGVVNLWRNPGSGGCNRAIAENKGWRVY